MTMEYKFRDVDLENLLTALVADVQYSLDRAAEPYYRRMAVKNIFAHMEGQGQYYRQLCIFLIYTQSETEIPLTRLAFLNADSYRITRTGKLDQDKQKNDTLGYLCFLLRTIGKYTDHPEDHFTRLFGSEEFRRLQEAIKIRDRITHPKKLADLDVTPEEVELVRTSALWYYAQGHQLIRDAILRKKKDPRFDPKIEEIVATDEITVRLFPQTIVDHVPTHFNPEEWELVPADEPADEPSATAPEDSPE